MPHTAPVALVLAQARAGEVAAGDALDGVHLAGARRPRRGRATPPGTSVDSTWLRDQVGELLEPPQGHLGEDPALVGDRGRPARSRRPRSGRWRPSAGRRRASGRGHAPCRSAGARPPRCEVRVGCRGRQRSWRERSGATGEVRIREKFPGPCRERFTSRVVPVTLTAREGTPDEVRADVLRHPRAVRPGRRRRPPRPGYQEIYAWFDEHGAPVASSTAAPSSSRSPPRRR